MTASTLPEGSFFIPPRQSPWIRVVASIRAFRSAFVRWTAGVGLGLYLILRSAGSGVASAPGPRRPVASVALVIGRPGGGAGLPVGPDRPLELDNLTSSLQVRPHRGHGRMVDAQLLADPPVRPLRRLPQLVGDDRPLARLVELPPGQVQGTGQGPLLLVGRARP